MKSKKTARNIKKHKLVKTILFVSLFLAVAALSWVMLSKFAYSSSVVINCTDSDGGDNPYVSGTTMLIIRNDSGAIAFSVVSDICEDSTHLAEYRCGVNNYGAISRFENSSQSSLKNPVFCSGGCFNGACAQPKPYPTPAACVDSDGLNYAVKGTCTDSSGKAPWNDSCQTSSLDGKLKLEEAYCGSDKYCYGLMVDCPNGCNDGVCIGNQTINQTANITKNETQNTSKIINDTQINECRFDGGFLCKGIKYLGYQVLPYSQFDPRNKRHYFALDILNNGVNVTYIAVNSAGSQDFSVYFEKTSAETSAEPCYFLTFAIAEESLFGKLEMSRGNAYYSPFSSQWTKGQLRKAIFVCYTIEGRSQTYPFSVGTQEGNISFRFTQADGTTPTIKGNLILNVSDLKYVKKCVDLDNGPDFYKKRTYSYDYYSTANNLDSCIEKKNGYSVAVDSCKQGENCTLSEAQCTSGNSSLPMVKSYPCSSDCVNGTCLVKEITCTDSDEKGSENFTQYEMQGTTTGLLKSGDAFQSTKVDSCSDSKTITEYVCNGQLIGSLNVSCDYGCSNGKCLTPATFSKVSMLSERKVSFSYSSWIAPSFKLSFELDGFEPFYDSNANYSISGSDEVQKLFVGNQNYMKLSVVKNSSSNSYSLQTLAKSKCFGWWCKPQDDGETFWSNVLKLKEQITILKNGDIVAIYDPKACRAQGEGKYDLSAPCCEGYYRPPCAEFSTASGCMIMNCPDACTKGTCGDGVCSGIETLCNCPKDCAVSCTVNSAGNVVYSYRENNRTKTSMINVGMDNSAPFCVGTDTVLKLGCGGENGKVPSRITSTCENGCNNGVCFNSTTGTCVDSDGGIKFKIFGQVTTPTRVYNDSCTDQFGTGLGYLNEYSCFDLSKIEDKNVFLLKQADGSYKIGPEFYIPQKDMMRTFSYPSNKMTFAGRVYRLIDMTKDSATFDDGNMGNLVTLKTGEIKNLDDKGNIFILLYVSEGNFARVAYFNKAGIQVHTTLYRCPDGCKNGKCNPITSVCVDSDGGKNIYVKGTAKRAQDAANDTCFKSQVTSYGYTQYSVVSACTGSDCFVNEAFCKPDQNNVSIVAQEVISCPKGCNNGACIR